MSDVAGIDRFGQKGAAAKPEPKTAEQKFFNRRRQSVDFDWRAFSTPQFAAALNAVTSGGAAVMVGGAHGGRGALISVYLNKKRDSTFVSDAEELLQWCHDVLEAFESGSEDIYLTYGIERRSE